ncbi:MAG: CRTAC1 family protein [Saprospiraceae bacterium]|nr:CRTAC1 family protein [Bacteroidia bacterium]NNL93233.1 CRTAC1 family protein [Saprospiraceae bacterium]
MIKILKVIILTAIISSLFTCTSDSGNVEKTEDYNPNKVMAETLLALHNDINFMNSLYENSDRADYLLAQPQSGNLMNNLKIKMRAGYELMNSNKNEQALEVFNEIEKELETLNTNQGGRYRLLKLRAVNYFRMGELENCINNHNEDSCILPFNDNSFHRVKTGSQAAIDDILELLKMKSDKNYIWLLNLAYMTLGQYPDNVPPEYLVPLYPKEEPNLVEPFINIGSTIGVDDNKLSGGSIIDDFTGDCYYDIISSSWSLADQIFFYVNNGDGSFTESHKKAGLEGITGGLNITHTDYNNDGHLDFMILRGAWLQEGQYPNSLLRNNGDGTFRDVTVESEILSKNPTLAAAWADFNNDGFLDCFVANESFKDAPPNPCELFINLKNGKFKNIAPDVNSNISGLFKGVTIGDIDNDLDQDIYISNLKGPNILLRNDATESVYGFSFTDVSQSSKTSGNEQSFPCWFFDYDNDGWLDIFSASYSWDFSNNMAKEYLNEMAGDPSGAAPPALYKNNKKGSFSNVSKNIGLDKICFAMGAGFGDFDNDGFQDIYLGTGEPDFKAVIPNRAFKNENGVEFKEVTSQSRLGHLQKGHGISFADLDFDGDQDIYAVMGGAFEGDNFFNALFENTNNSNNWIKIKLQGVQSNRPAIGARLELVVSTNNSHRSIHRFVSNGSSFGENPFTQEIGFLINETIDKLNIIWPSGQQSTFSNLQSNKYYLITEDQLTPQELNHTTTKFKKDKNHHHQH